MLSWCLMVVWPCYVGLRVRGSGRTVGERLARIAVRDEQTGLRLGTRAACSRTFISTCLYACWGIGFAASCRAGARNGSRRTWHDASGGAVVVRNVRARHVPADAQEVV
jgi:uncharacterized RDD family membrane protein YckC